MDVINYLVAKVLGKKLVGIESENNDYLFVRGNALVFDDGTRVVIRLEGGEVWLKIVPADRGAPVVEGRTIW